MSRVSIARQLNMCPTKAWIAVAREKDANIPCYTAAKCHRTFAVSSSCQAFPQPTQSKRRCNLNPKT